MPADASIYANLLRAPKSVAEYDAERQATQANALSNLLNQAKYDEYQRGVEQQSQLSRLLSGGADADALQRGGFLKQATDLRESNAKVAAQSAQAGQSMAAAEATKWKTAHDQLQAIYDAASTATDEPSYQRSLSGLTALGVDISKVPKSFDPAYVAQAKKLALSQKERLEADARQRGLDLQKRGQDITIRGQDLVNARAEDLNKIRQQEIQVVGGKGAFEAENKLRDEFANQSKSFISIRDAYGKVQAAAKNPSAAGDIALIFAYMKILDPTSVVREGEFATAQNAGSIPDRVRNAYNRAMNGERLGDAQRQDMVSQAGKVYAQQLQGQQRLVDQYKGLSKQYGLRDQNVVTDYGATPAGGDGSDPLGLLGGAR